jgi:hypothetical protein
MAKKKASVSSRAKVSASPKKLRDISGIQLIEVPPKIQPKPEMSQEVTAITPVPKPQMAEIISVPSLNMEIVKNRHDENGEVVGKYIADHVQGVRTTLLHLRPLIDEMKRKYSLLPRTKHADGTYQTIRGCRSFKEWVEKRLGKSERAVYYLLAGGNPHNEKAKLQREAAKQRRNAPCAVTLTSQGTPLEPITTKAKDPFDADLNTIEASGEQSSARLARAIDEITNAKSAIETLRDEMLNIVNDPPESSPDASDHQECVRGLKRIIDHLEGAASESEDVFIALAAIE